MVCCVAQRQHVLKGAMGNEMFPFSNPFLLVIKLCRAVERSFHFIPTPCHTSRSCTGFDFHVHLLDGFFVQNDLSQFQILVAHVFVSPQGCMLLWKIWGKIGQMIYFQQSEDACGGHSRPAGSNVFFPDQHDELIVFFQKLSSISFLTGVSRQGLGKFSSMFVSLTEQKQQPQTDATNERMNQGIPSESPPGLASGRLVVQTVDRCSSCL